MLALGIFAILAGGACAVYGIAQNNSTQAQLESLFNSGTVNPGDTFLYIGIAVAVVGVILAIVGSKKR